MPSKKKAKSSGKSKSTRSKSARRIPKPQKPEPKTSKEDREKAQAARLRILFNTTPTEKAAVLEFQGGVCAVTKTNVNKKGEPLKLSLDHCHRTGKLRGFLHPVINKGLHFFNDDPALLRATADYLDSPPFTQVAGEDVFGVMGRITKKAKSRVYGPHGSKTPQPRAVFARVQKETKEAI